MKLELIALLCLVCSRSINAFTPPSSSVARNIKRTPVMRATTVGEQQKSQSVTDTIPYKIFDFMMNVPLFHDILFGVYRSQSVDRAEALGINWRGTLKELNDKSKDLKQIQNELCDKDLVIPNYYYAPIHAYADGNLCWDSAMEEDLWSKLMIAPLFNGAIDGDVKMRQNWIDNVDNVIESPPKKVMDMGCGTGLSMYMCQQQWQDAEYLGVDMSTYKLAISEDKRRGLPESLSEKVKLIHAPAENCGEPDNTFDLATICLVNHESPLWVSKALFAEAYRTLKPGGYFTILDLDKDNLEILLTSPFVAAIYKQTEPYVNDFLALNIEEALEECGFTVEKVVQASKSHKAYVARK